ncbi:MAG: glycerate 2-kinase [Sulfurimonas sp.]|jgi:glycerate 2-kinase|uniref:glycerate kinase type-2 family protein n=1 Tax=Sulfurimonas sp. TaxID=2022749 RepID=UPI0039E511A2
MANESLALSIFSKALESSLPKNFMHKHCQLVGDILFFKDTRYDLSKYKNLYIFGSGKAAYTMAKEAENILEDKIYKGLIVSPYDEGKLQNIEVLLGSHPIPSQLSIDAATALSEMMSECNENDLYIYLLSGGSSSLMELPISPIDLSELQETTSLMLRNNLEIHEINCVRKHLSMLKGGRLAQMCKAKGIVLVVSDIIDDDLQSIGSAPLYADKSTFIEAKEILQAKNIFEKMPISVQTVLQKGVDAEIEESPSVPLERVKHIIIASNKQAIEQATFTAKSKGLSVKKINEPMQGEVGDMVNKIFKILHACEEECIIFGGECTVDLQGNGKGGRNQHAALLALKKIQAQALNVTFLSAGTDGIDGNSDAAGAVVSGYSYQSNLKIDDYLKNFDSYNYLKQSDSLIITGPSGTNVIDIAILIKGE